MLHQDENLKSQKNQKVSRIPNLGILGKTAVSPVPLFLENACATMHLSLRHLDLFLIAPHRQVNMSHLYPRTETLQGSFYSPMAAHRHQQQARATPYQARPELYGAFSVVEDAKDKAKKLGNEASKEFEKAAAKASPKSDKIEMYSGKYYAACTFGGMMACVS